MSAEPQQSAAETLAEVWGRVSVASNTTPIGETIHPWVNNQLPMGSPRPAAERVARELVPVLREAPDLAAHRAQQEAEFKAREKERRRDGAGRIIMEEDESGDELAAEDPDTDWLWHGYLPTGALALLAAKPKAGKSTLVFALLRALEQGTPFLGLPTRKARVLYVGEESRKQLKSKTVRAGLDGDWHRFWSRSRFFGADWPAVVEKAGRMARERGCDYVIFDTFNGLARLRGDNENTSGPMLEAIEPMHLLKDQGLGVLLVAHERKSEGDMGDTIRGSNALTGEVDVIATLDRPPRGSRTARRIEALSRYDETPEVRNIDYDDHGGYSTTDTPVILQEKQRREDDAAILARLGEPTAREFAEVADCSEKTARRRLDKLIEVGRAKQNGGGSGHAAATYAATDGSLGEWATASFNGRDTAVEGTSLQRPVSLGQNERDTAPTSRGLSLLSLPGESPLESQIEKGQPQKALVPSDLDSRRDRADRPLKGEAVSLPILGRPSSPVEAPPSNGNGPPGTASLAAAHAVNGAASSNGNGNGAVSLNTSPLPLADDGLPTRGGCSNPDRHLAAWERLGTGDTVCSKCIAESIRMGKRLAAVA